MTNRLHFFTTRYPFGNSESFVHNELHNFSKAYDEIYIYPIKYKDSEQLPMRDLPSNVKVLAVPHAFNFKKIIIKNCLLLLQFLLLDKKLDPKNEAVKKPYLKLQMSYFAMAVHLSQFIEQHIESGVAHTFYSFWMHEAALALSILKHKKSIDRFNFKCHGFDVYNEVHKEGFIPFRVVNYHYTQHIITISNKNAHYISAHYPNFKDKLKVIYLGSDDKGISAGVKEKDNTYLIFSCANLIPLKRVAMIPQLLMHCKDLNIKWVHAGDGAERDQVLKYAKDLPSNIQIELLGSIPHQEVYEYYKNHDIDVFLHVSESEGLPVSMMEAISFGVPIMACDVGGVSEIVNENTGVLLPKEFEIQAVATTLEQFLLNASQNGLSKASIRNYWKAHFDHTVNVAALINLLKS